MEKVNIFDQIDRNKRKSILLGALVFVSLIALVYVISEIFAPEFSFFILIFASLIIIIHSVVSYSYGDKIVLSATGAKPVEDERKYAHLINTIEGLSIAAGIPKPKIYVMDNDEINAYATGRDPRHASIAVTRGALEKLDRDELEGVIGHEMSHIKNYDIRFAMLVAVLVGLVAIISNILLRSMWWGGRGSRRERDERGLGILIIVGIVLAIVSPIIVRLVQLAISRKREYLADASGAQLTRYPDGLADALEKIKKYNEGKMKVSEAVSHLFISDPNKSPLDNLFATHPPIEERIKILRAM
jgi:heat shock protein HtpX